MYSTELTEAAAWLTSDRIQGISRCRLHKALHSSYQREVNLQNYYFQLQ